MANIWSKIQDGIAEKKGGGNSFFSPPAPPPSPANPFISISQPSERKVRITDPAGNVVDRMYGRTVEGPVAPPKITINTPQSNLSSGKFIAKAAVATVAMASDTMQFVAEYLTRTSPLEIVAKLNPTDPILQNFSTKSPQGKLIADKWTQLVRPAVSIGGAEVDRLTQNLQAAEYIQPSEQWKNATWQDRFSRSNIGETIFNIGADVAGSVAGYAINPTAGFALAAGSTAQSLKEIARENGVDEKTSDRIAIGTGLVVGLIDKIIPDELSKPFVSAFAKRFGTFIYRTAKTGAKEAATEVVQEDIQMLAEVTLRHDLTFDEFVSRNVMAAFGGLLGGSGMNVIATTVNSARSMGAQEPAAPDQPMFKEKTQTQEETLLSEAKKFKTAEEFIKFANGSATQYGDYSPGLRVGGSSPDSRRLPDLGVDPEMEVTIYRGIDDATGKVKRKINDGDFVTTDYDSALSYASGPKNVVSMTVKAKDLFSEDAQEFLSEPFYVGSEYIYSTKYDAKPQRSDAELTKIWKEANTENELDTLTKEAKKYKSAEDFVKAQGTLFYHYTNADFSEFKTNTQLKADGVEIANPVRRDSAGIYFFNSILAGDGGLYGKNRIEAYLDIKNPKRVSKDFNISSLTQKQIDYYKSQGFDALVSPKETVVFDTSQIKTKTQLEEIWNKANKQKEKVLYHGTAKGNKFTKFDPSKAETGVGSNVIDQGNQIYLTKSKAAANYFAELAETKKALKRDGDMPSVIAGDVLEFTLADDARVKEIPDMPRGGGLAEVNKIIEDAKKEGYDAISFLDKGFTTIEGSEKIYKILTEEGIPETVIILNPDVIEAKEDSAMFSKTNAGYKLVPREEAIKRVQEYKTRLKMDNLEVQLVDEILTGDGKAFASSFGNTLSFVEGIPQFVADHEIIHSIMRNVDKFDIFKKDGITRSVLLEEARQMYGDMSDFELEERIAESFELYVEARINNASTTWMGKLENFFKQILAIIEKMFGTDNSVATKDFFKWVYGGSQTAPVILSGTDTGKYTQIKNGNIILDFSKIDTASFKEMTPEEYLRLQETLKEKRDAFKTSEAGAVIDVEIEANKEAQSILKENVVSGIKNSEYYKKEGSILDTFGEGYLMRRIVNKSKGKPYVRYVVVSSAKKNEMTMEGYSVVSEIDSLASEFGFDSGLAFLEDQMRLSQLETSFEGRMDEHLYNTDVEFKNAKNKLENYRKMTKGETVTIGKYMHDVGLVERTKDRRVRVSAVQRFFGFSDADMRKVRGNRDVSTMTSGEFDEYMYKLEERATEYADIAQKRAELMTLIAEKELFTFENLRQAMKLPPIKEMTTEQMSKFARALEPYQRGDAFLPVRKLETIDNTKLEGMKTIREVREALSIETDVPLSDLENVKSSVADYVRYDVSLAEQNPLYKAIVENVIINQVSADTQLIKILNTFYELVKNARRSKNRSVSDRLIPQDKNIVSWLEADPEKKKKLQKSMTAEELELASFMRTEYAKIRDYLVKQQVIERGIENYYTHIRRGFLETVKEDGLIKAFKEVFRQNELDEISFKIIDDDTGTILPLEKFFSFSLERTGGLVPTQNVARSFENYLKTFYKKTALDSTVPLIDIYVYSLEPKQTTETGLQVDRSLRKFVNEWLNNKRGRKFSYGGLLKQGGKLDTIIRFSKAFTTFLDLGFNLSTGLASTAGEQTMVYKGIGAKKHALGVARFATSKGRDMVNKYESVTGKGIFDELFLPSKDIGDQLLGGAMVLFSASSKIANNFYFLGSITDEEYQSGIVSDERLAGMKLDIGRWRPVAEFKSIIGSTSIGQVGTQYKTWLIPIVTTTLKNWTNIAKMLKGGKNPIGTREFQEEFRGVVLVTLLYLLFAGNDDDDESFIGNLKSKIKRELFTSIGALSPAAFLATPRLVSFVEDMRDAIQQLIVLERYETKEGYKGIEALKRVLTPKAIRQFLPKDSETSAKNPFIKSSGNENPFIRK